MCFYEFFIGFLMVELRDQAKRLLSKLLDLLAAGREDAWALYLLSRFSLNKKALLCASLKIRHLIIKQFFLKIFLSLASVRVGRVFPITLL